VWATKREPSKAQVLLKSPEERRERPLTRLIQISGERAENAAKRNAKAAAKIVPTHAIAGMGAEVWLEARTDEPPLMGCEPWILLIRPQHLNDCKGTWRLRFGWKY
jgi:hypothetical protein